MFSENLWGEGEGAGEVTSIILSKYPTKHKRFVICKLWI